MSIDVGQLVATSIASAIGAVFAGAIGLRYAVAKFRRERAFERRLAWYETAAKDLVDGASKIIRAVNCARNPLLAGEREEAWRAAGLALGRLLSLETEAELYATAAAYQAVREAAEDVRLVAKGAEMALQLSPPAREQPEAEARVEQSLKLYELASKMMLHAASRLANDVREHLDLDIIERDWRLYDDEFRQHLEQLDKLGLRDHSESQTHSAAAETEPSPSKLEGTALKTDV